MAPEVLGLEEMPHSYENLMDEEEEEEDYKEEEEEEKEEDYEEEEEEKEMEEEGAEEGEIGKEEVGKKNDFVEGDFGGEDNFDMFDDFEFGMNDEELGAAENGSLYEQVDGARVGEVLEANGVKNCRIGEGKGKQSGDMFGADNVDMFGADNVVDLRTPSPPKKRAEIIEISSTEHSPSSAIKRMKIADGGEKERGREELKLEWE